VLTGEDITDDEYAHAQNVWKEFGIATLQSYHDLYLKTDVLLLADIFENFRNTSLKHYSLDPAHYLSAPALTWDAMLRHTRIWFDLIADPEMHKMIERGMRGGICMISKRYAKANNKYMGDAYRPNEPKSYIIYLDANNLYGWAMSQAMPYGYFEWVDPAAIELDYILKIPEDDFKGYILEVDLEYPARLHDAHNDYPLAVERFDIKIENMSDQQLKLIRAYGRKEGESTKLVPNLYNKSHYVVHYRLLQFYVKHGLKVTKVHKVLSFSQSKWLAPYIDKNSKLRAEAKNAFEKDFFKLMNNSVYGKTCENLRKRMDVKIVTSESSLKKLTEKPTFMSQKIISENLALIHMQKIEVLIDRYTTE